MFFTSYTKNRPLLRLYTVSWSILYMCNTSAHTWPFLLVVLRSRESRVSSSRVLRIIVLCNRWKTLQKLHGNRPNAFHFEYRVLQRVNSRVAMVKCRLGCNFLPSYKSEVIFVKIFYETHIFCAKVDNALYNLLFLQ